MFSNQLGRLQGATNTRGATIGLYIAAALAAVAVGLLVLLFGFFWELISLYERTGTLRPSINLGPRIAIPTEWLEADRGVMRGATALLIMMGGLMVGVIALTYLIYRAASAIANQRSLEQHEAAFASYESMCRRRGITAIRSGVRPIFAEDVPAIHDQTVNWLRQGPRHLMQMIVSAAVALWIDPLLGGLALVAVLLVRQLVSLIERRRRRGRPVLLEQRNLAAGKFADWCCGSPLLSTVYEPSAVESLYRDLVTPVRKIQTTLNNQAVYKMPLSMLATAVLYSLLLFVGAIRVVDADNQLSVVAVLTLLLASAIALYSFNRLRKSHKALEQVSRNVDRLAACFGRLRPTRATWASPAGD